MYLVRHLGFQLQDLQQRKQVLDWVSKSKLKYKSLYV